jgi:hypothetical protein
MTARIAGSRRPVLPSLLMIGAAVVVWNAIFDLLVTRGVKEYLFRHAEYALGRGPLITMDVIMGQTVSDAVVTASAWALLVVVAGECAIALAVRRDRERGRCTR